MYSFKRIASFFPFVVNRSLITVSLCGLLLSGCVPPQSDTEVDDRAKAVMAAYQEGKVEKILAFYGKDFYKARSDTQWKTTLDDLYEKNGKVETLSFRNKQADTRFSGKFYIFQFDTVHTNKKRARHILTLRRHVEKMEEVVVIGHQIKVR